MVSWLWVGFGVTRRALRTHAPPAGPARPAQWVWATRQGPRQAQTQRMTRVPTPIPCPPANPPRNCTGKQLGYKWADAASSASSPPLPLPRVDGYDACCRACQSDYGCKRFQGGKRGCTLLYDVAGAAPVKGPRKSYVAVMQPAV